MLTHLGEVRYPWEETRSKLWANLIWKYISVDVVMQIVSSFFLRFCYFILCTNSILPIHKIVIVERSRCGAMCVYASDSEGVLVKMLFYCCVCWQDWIHSHLAHVGHELATLLIHCSTGTHYWDAEVKIETQKGSKLSYEVVLTVWVSPLCSGLAGAWSVTLLDTGWC